MSVPRVDPALREVFTVREVDFDRADSIIQDMTAGDDRSALTVLRDERTAAARVDQTAVRTRLTRVDYDAA